MQPEDAHVPEAEAEAAGAREEEEEEEEEESEEAAAADALVELEEAELEERARLLAKEAEAVLEQVDAADPSVFDLSDIQARHNLPSTAMADVLTCVQKHVDAIRKGRWPAHRKEFAKRFQCFTPPFVKVHHHACT